jgi:hypothetical protein
VKNNRYKIWLWKTNLVPTKSTSLQTALALEALLSEGQLLHEEQISVEEKSDIPTRNSKTNKFQNRRTEFRTKVNLYIHVIQQCSYGSETWKQCWEGNSSPLQFPWEQALWCDPVWTDPHANSGCWLAWLILWSEVPYQIGDDHNTVVWVLVVCPSHIHLHFKRLQFMNWHKFFEISMGNRCVYIISIGFGIAQSVQWRATGWTAGGSIPGRNKRLPFNPQFRDRLWGSSSLLFNRYRELLSRG